MKKGVFYRHYNATSVIGIQAIKTEGYINGDIGVHKHLRNWYATHIPTGGLLVSGAWTKEESLEDAKKALQDEKVQALIIATVESDKHKEFEERRKEAEKNDCPK